MSVKFNSEKTFFHNLYQGRNFRAYFACRLQSFKETRKIAVWGETL